MNTMRYFFRRCALCLTLLAVTALAGCSSAILGGDEMGVTPYSPSSLQSLKTGRQYVSQGRYELAKEQYLVALVASNDPQLRVVINQELAAVDLMIQTLR